MAWKYIAYRIGQVFGASACIFIALWLIFNPHFEPVLWLRLFEIIGSLVAAVILVADFFDIHPEYD